MRGRFYYLYMVEDVWSRKIVGWEVHEEECVDLAAELVTRSCEMAGISREGLVLHSDNGGPMKGSTMLATLQHLGIVASFSRPQVSDDNPYSEALFRTLKYRPGYPRKPFESLAAARAWVAGFVAWYNTEHLHSGIGFVTPEDRHQGRDLAILEHRRKVYDASASPPAGPVVRKNPIVGRARRGLPQPREADRGLARRAGTNRRVEKRFTRQLP